MYKDCLNPSGFFQVQAYNADGELIDEYLEQNLVVTLGKATVARLLAGEGTKISKISFGVSDTSPALSDTALSGAFTKAITSFVYPDATSVQFSWSLEAAEANGMTIKEFGLLSDDGTLFARKVRSEIVKTSAVRLVGTWKIVIS